MNGNLRHRVDGHCHTQHISTKKSDFIFFAQLATTEDGELRGLQQERG